MIDDEDLPVKRIKAIPSSLRNSSRFRIGNESLEAENSLIYQWYLALNLSNEYLRCCRTEGKGELYSLYKDFGDVTLPFTTWWLKIGRKIFAETKPFKKVKVIDRHTIDELLYKSDRLILEIPLSIKKQTAMRQIGAHIRAAYKNRIIDVWQESTAKRQLIKSKIHKNTIELSLEIYRIKKNNPQLKNYEIGEKAGIVLDLLRKDTSGQQITLDLERRRMTIAVSRYLKQAKNLIDNAELGIFPQTKPVKK